MIFLAQTDTTAGLLSKDLKALNAIKNRPLNQPCLITTAKFSQLLNLTRVPKIFKNRVRKATKTTFLYKNKRAIRVIKDERHEKFLAKFDWLYSTSANLHGKNFDEAWARGVADVVVDENFSQNGASKILKVSNRNIKRLR
ncbi:Sua5/YciO/YrdC/YwlC family protein [Campylobacter gastrosuis]|uniref:Sua5 YciO YrdC YwlC family protein n=1 Tax=Campylobacter gastrosuis TaxID=2974576 RepID=A0ABT7HRM2_9BACT|nr:Sua5/YciO/YrdC/YwlC family protein [Campylobacter gastrosuis]MDL0089505.1 Sua5 YciO YrdC YwlC family protein [Campylobacter gastrosuis]